MESAVETPANPPIARLTPLAEVLALIEREVKPVAPRTVALSEALHAVLAADVVAPTLPTSALALIDGWALAAEATRDAGGYAPAPLPRMPLRIDAGEPLPPGADCVTPLDAIAVKDNRAEALLPVNPGGGVLPAGGDCDGGKPLRRSGERLRAVDVAALSAVGIAQVSVRMPRLRIAPVHSDAIIGNATRLIASDAARHGSAIDANGDLRAAFAVSGTDAIVAIGGTGSGRNDASVSLLARQGRLALHGIALTPGETAAVGFAEQRPVLLLPGRLDAALAVWLTLGRRMLHRLQGAAHFDDPLEVLTLSRKVASTVGMAELVPVRRTGDSVEPLATKYLPWSALTRSDGWVLVPAESEGYSAGAKVSVRPWP